MWRAVRLAKVEAFALPSSNIYVIMMAGDRLANHGFRVLSRGSYLNSACCVFVVLQSFQKSNYHFLVYVSKNAFPNM